MQNRPPWSTQYKPRGPKRVMMDVAGAMLFWLVTNRAVVATDNSLSTVEPPRSRLSRQGGHSKPPEAGQLTTGPIDNHPYVYTEYTLIY